MGLCLGTSKEETDPQTKINNQNIDQQMIKDFNSNESVKKLLLLGAGESGKSTLFKQIKTIYGDGFTKKHRTDFIQIIHSSMIKSMITLIEYSEKFADGAVVACTEEKNAIAALTLGDDRDGDHLVGDKLAEHSAAIATLWADPAIQKTYENRNKFWLPDSAKYFFDKISEVSNPDWLPEDQDILRARVRTTGIIENAFEIQNNKFKMFDVGGQRNERKKWIHCFEGVTAVLFVGVLSEYNQVLYEDETQNRMVETLQLFEKTLQYEWFEKTAIILFLNKRDLFADKITKYRLSDCSVFRKKSDDVDYTDEEIQSMFPAIDTYEGGIQAIQTKFWEKNTNESKLTYTHVTCATDRGNVTAVFEAVKDIIINLALAENAF